MKLSDYDNQTVRITLKDGMVFEGYSVHNSSDYDFHEFGRNEQSLQIDDWLFFRRDIKSVEIAAESDTTVWMSRICRSLLLDHDTFIKLEKGQQDIELPVSIIRKKPVRCGDMIRFEDRTNEDDVLYMEVTGIDNTAAQKTAVVHVKQAE